MLVDLFVIVGSNKLFVKEIILKRIPFGYSCIK